MYKTLAIALAASAAALPSSQPRASSNGEFGLIMDVSTTGTPIYVSLNAVKDDHHKDLVLIGQRLSVYPGSRAYLDTVSPSPDYQALNLDLDGVEYGLFAQDIGDRYRAKTFITAKKGKEQFEWSISKEGNVYHKLAAATNQFLACNTTVKGQTYLALGWGIADQNGLPKGCQATTVHKNAN